MWPGPQVAPEVVGHEDGLIERFSGDAIMVMFNATGDQPDHALRAARAALALQRASSTLSWRYLAQADAVFPHLS